MKDITSNDIVRATEITNKVKILYPQAKRDYVPEYDGDYFEGMEFTPSSGTTFEALLIACSMIKAELHKDATTLGDTIRVFEY